MPITGCLLGLIVYWESWRTMPVISLSWPWSVINKQLLADIVLRIRVRLCLQLWCQVHWQTWTQKRQFKAAAVQLIAQYFGFFCPNVWHYSQKYKWLFFLTIVPQQQQCQWSCFNCNCEDYFCCSQAEKHAFWNLHDEIFPSFISFIFVW